MKLCIVVKYAGWIAGIIGGILILLGVIGFFANLEILNVKRFSNFFWYANTILLFAIFCLIASYTCNCGACKDKQE